MMFGEMKKVVIVLLVLVVGGFGGRKFRNLLESPCPDVFQYRYDEQGQLYGVLRISNPVDPSVVKLQVELSVGNNVEGYNGHIELAQPKNKVIEDVLLGRPINYNVHFPRWNGIPPKITKILVNGELICYGPKIPMNLVLVLTTINLQHLLKINLQSDSSMLSFSDSNSPDLEDQEPSPSSIRNQYIFRPSAQNRINFNPQMPKDFSKIYPGNPFLNNLATSNPNAARDDPQLEAQYVSVNQDRPAVVENLKPKELLVPPYVPTQSPQTRGGPLATSPANRENRGIQLDASSALAGNPFFRSATFTESPSIKKEETTTLPPVQNRGITEATPGNVEGTLDTNTVFARNPFLQKTITTTPPSIPKETTTVPPIIQNKNVKAVPDDQDVVLLPSEEEISTRKIESKFDDMPFGEICGRSTVANSLVVHGEPVSRGAYPWLVAMFWLKNLGPEFRCSGSLVSERHVVTAAHCLKNGTRTLRPEELLLILGKLNIKNWYREIGLQVGVESIDIHPSYQPLSADADIAVITLSEKVTFTKFIRPICLWTGSSKLKDIEGERGTVVGWGKDENGDFMTEVPKKVTMPVVSQEDCIRSKYSFRDITSERTFCAGFRNGTGPCNGDSGSGFILKKDDRWILRGIVSTSLLDQEQKSCDLRHYVVFTDASKFLDWLLSKIR